MANGSDVATARAALDEGDRSEARRLLMAIVRTDLDNGEAWHLLGLAVDDQAQKAECERRAEAAGYRPLPPPDEMKTFFQSLPPAPVKTISPLIPTASEPPPTQVQRTRPPSARPQRTPLLWGLAGLLILVLAGGGWLVLRQREQAAAGNPLLPAAEATATPDLTAACQPDAATYTKAMTPLFERWQEQVKLTGTTPRIALSNQIGELQDLRREVRAIKAPGCTADWHAVLLRSMDDTIQSYLEFAGQSDEERVTARLEMAQDDMLAYADGLDYLAEVAKDGTTSAEMEAPKPGASPTIKDVVANHEKRGYKFEADGKALVADNKFVEISIYQSTPGQLDRIRYMFTTNEIQKAAEELRAFVPEWQGAEKWVQNNAGNKRIFKRSATHFGRMLIICDQELLLGETWFIEIYYL